MPGVGALDVPALPGLGRGPCRLYGRFRRSCHGRRVHRGSSASRTRRPVDGDVIRQRADLCEFVQHGARSGESCRFAGPAPGLAGCRSPPPAGTASCPACGRSTRLRQAHWPPRGDFVMQPSTASSSRARPIMRWSGLPGDRLQVREDPGLDPLVAAFPDRGGSAGTVGDRRIGAAKAQDLDEFLEDDPVAYPRLVAAQQVGVIDRAVRQQRGELVPEGLPAAMMGWQAQGLP